MKKSNIGKTRKFSNLTSHEPNNNLQHHQYASSSSTSQPKQCCSHSAQSPDEETIESTPVAATMKLNVKLSSMTPSDEVILSQTDEETTPINTEKPSQILPNLKYTTQSFPELNTPEEIDFIEKNVQQNEQLRIKSLLKMMSEESGRNCMNKSKSYSKSQCSLNSTELCLSNTVISSSESSHESNKENHSNNH